MRIQNLLTPVLVSFAVFLAGCSTPVQQSVALESNYLQTGPKKVAVVMSELPKPDTFFPGADCLLCLGVASLANRSLTSAVQSWSSEEMLSVKGEMRDIFKRWGFDVVLVDEPVKFKELPDRKEKALGFASKDFSAVQQRTGADHMLFIDVKTVGVRRNYASYVPTGPALTWLVAEAYMVNLKDHRFSWYESINLSRQADGQWDEAPKFPGLTNAYFQTLEEAKDQIKKPFKKP